MGSVVLRFYVELPAASPKAKPGFFGAVQTRNDPGAVARDMAIDRFVNDVIGRWR